MALCFKCTRSIKPASLAVEVKGERYHPTCLNCAICDRQLWGKPFSKNRDGQLVCETPCTPQVQQPAQPAQFRPASASMQRPTTAVSRRPNSALQKQANMQAEQNKPVYDLSMYKKPMVDHESNSHLHNKMCKVCNSPLVNKRFVTYENGDTICQECDIKLSVRPPRVNSAHMIVCSVCDNIVKGRKYFTEPNGSIICDNCEQTGQRCLKCNLLFKANESPAPRVLANGMKFHFNCLDCSVCHNKIITNDFYQNESSNPMCLPCFETSKLPKCIVCSRHISGEMVLIENQPFHADCFKCNQCGNSLTQNTGYFKSSVNGQPICSSCNIKINGPKCARCSIVIETDGITFNSKDYHKDCFKCDKCNVELFKMKKTLTDKTGNELYCEPCFTQNFAPRCNKCNEPIQPHLPGTQYEDKVFHKECFGCARCKKTLANKKFFKSGNILICEQCF